MSSPAAAKASLQAKMWAKKRADASFGGEDAALANLLGGDAAPPEKKQRVS